MERSNGDFDFSGADFPVAEFHSFWKADFTFCFSVALAVSKLVSITCSGVTLGARTRSLIAADDDPTAPAVCCPRPCAGGVAAAVRAVRAAARPGLVIEVECDSVDQVREALAAGARFILLDNMPPEMMVRAVAIANGRATLEASGGVTLDRVRAIAESGVDYISSGAITHSVRGLDVGLDFL